MAAPMELTKTHRILIGVVVFGAVVIAGIGFAGSYAAVRELALQKGFGNFSYVFPIGIDAGICVLLALDLLLTWIRIPFPLLRQTAWLLTAATIAFNGAAAWPDPLGVGMHAVIPILFVVSVEAARHAIGRIADITADKHMEGVRLTRWLLSPIPTFLLWRRMKLWELRSYDAVIKLEQERLVYRARLRSRYGRAWRRKAPVESLMPLRLARYGVPLAETAPSGLAAAGIEPVLLPPAPRQQELELERADRAAGTRPAAGKAAGSAAPPREQRPDVESGPVPEQLEYVQEPQPDLNSPWFEPPHQDVVYEGGYDPSFDLDEQWYEEQRRAAQQRDLESDLQPRQQPELRQELQQDLRYEPGPEDTGSFPIPAGPGGRTRQLGEGGGVGGVPEPEQLPIPGPREELGLPDDMSREDAYYQVFRQSINGQGLPTKQEFGANIEAAYGVSLSDSSLKRYLSRFQNRLNAELEEDHIA
ncbi:DUF2637 domain-containing protein [Streptomyces montanus]|uniref:DUF2637 domain-containing protein n=1 Tax=Streptomyces montanus TaxID=2580423 RepID=A0A5R9FDZ9_9ACTN|nr:DUF2637 domain-containing protein [Streptomyces montanus]TLS42047.1 DUF2637 domain-containing protein [Streptomyces montanus]